MAQHEVDVKLPSLEMGKADAVFTVKQDHATLGALHISRGAVVWFPAGNSYGHKLTWASFAKLMVEKGTRKEIR